MRPKGTLVYFFCIVLSLFLAANSFAAEPESNSPQRFAFAVMGDNRDGDPIFRKIIESLNADLEIGFAVNCGDLTPHGREREFKHYLLMTGKSRIEIYPVIGNHDIVDSRTNYEKFLAPRYYSFDYGNSHFVMLDNVSQGGLGKAQWSWLRKDLSKHSREHVFVFFHKPLLDPSGHMPHYIMKPRNEVQELIALFQKYNVKYVFFGHIHGYGRAERDGIVYILTGGAGSPLYLPAFSGGFYHYVKVNVDGKNISDEVVRISSP